MNKLTCFATGLFLVLLLCFGVEAFAADQFGLTHGTDKRLREWEIPTDSTFHLYAARNEWEPFQVMMKSTAGLTGVNVEVSAFTGPGDDIEDIELYRVHYLPVTADTISHEPPDLAKVGYWPDALVPFVDHFYGEDRDGAPFDVELDQQQAVFVDVYVPEDQTSGDYSATVTVTYNGGSQWTGTITLTVWNFTLPNELSIDSNYGYSQSNSCNWHSAHGGTVSCSELTDMYYLEFARHRMGLYNWRRSYPTYAWNDETQTIDFDWTAFDETHGPYLDGTFYKPGYKFTGMRFHAGPSGRPEYVSVEDWDREWWQGWADHFRQKGWLDQTWYYLPDEPTPGEYPTLIALADRIHEADEELTVMITEQIEQELVDHVDLWCPDEPLFSDSLPWPPYPEAYDERREAGDQTWWYNCVSATIGFDYANHMIDYPSTQMRDWLWLTRRYHFEGILFWQTNYSYGYQNPWETMWIAKFLCQGDGSVIYPGVTDEIGGINDIPVASLRMKYLREAMEDYEYFHILDESGEEEWVDDVTRTIAPKTYIWEHNWSVVLDWRRKVAEKILGTLDETPPSPPTGLSAVAGEYKIAVDWTAPTAADLAGFDIWYAIYEGDAFFGGMVDKNTTEFTLTGLTAGREHKIWIKAFDTNGNRSAASEIVNATPTEPAVDDDAAVDDDVIDDDANDKNVADDDEGSKGEKSNKADDDDDASFGCGGRG